MGAYYFNRFTKEAERIESLERSNQQHKQTTTQTNNNTKQPTLEFVSFNLILYIVCIRLSKQAYKLMLLQI